MKLLILKCDNGDVIPVRPAIGSRLALAVKDQGSGARACFIGGDDVDYPGRLMVVPPAREGEAETPLSKDVFAVPIERFYRQWPVEGIEVVWAETEQAWFERVAAVTLSKGADFPPGARYIAVIDETELPATRDFRAAWRMKDGAVAEDLDASREIAHQRRRARRDIEFAPLDDAIAKRIPGVDEAAIEIQRQAVREKYAGIQDQIDAAQNVATLKAIEAAA